MADFKDVVKQLEKNKVSQDAGFSALETALGADTLAKSQKEENEKNKKKKDEKELSYLQKMGQEIGLLNKNFRDLAKDFANSVLPNPLAPLKTMKGSVPVAFFALL